MSISIALIEFAGLIIVAVLQIKGNKEQKKSSEFLKKQEERGKLRKEESLLQLQLVSANTKLTKIIAKKVQNKETNGDVEEANEAVAAAERAYYKFLNDVAMGEMAERS